MRIVLLPADMCSRGSNGLRRVAHAREDGYEVNAVSPTAYVQNRTLVAMRECPVQRTSKAG
jgi:hypothetical protein